MKQQGLTYSRLPELGGKLADRRVARHEELRNRGREKHLCDLQMMSLATSYRLWHEKGFYLGLPRCDMKT